MVQPDLFSGGSRGADGSRQSVVALKREETVSVEVIPSRRNECGGNMSFRTFLVHFMEGNKPQITTHGCAH